MAKTLEKLQLEAKDLFAAAKNGLTYQFLGDGQNRSNTHMMSYVIKGFGQTLRMDIEIVLGVSSYCWLDFVYPWYSAYALWMVSDDFLNAWKNDKVSIELMLNTR